MYHADSHLKRCIYYQPSQFNPWTCYKKTNRLHDDGHALSQVKGNITFRQLTCAHYTLNRAKQYASTNPTDLNFRLNEYRRHPLISFLWHISRKDLIISVQLK